jgi:hypothetical protein
VALNNFALQGTMGKTCSDTVLLQYITVGLWILVFTRNTGTFYGKRFDFSAILLLNLNLYGINWHKR